MSKVDDAVVEIDAALADMAPKLEGLEDYRRLNLKDATQAQVQAAIDQYSRRKALLEQSRATLAALQGDGYPDLTIPDVSISVLEDLQENADTIEAALKQFKTNAASGLGLGAGQPQQK